MTTDQDRAGGPATGEAAGPGWLPLVYRVPPEPTRPRGAVRRHVKPLGTGYR